MKKRNFFVPDQSVGAEFKEDKQDSDKALSKSSAQSGNSKSAPVAYDWLMNHKVNPIEQVPYLERLIDGGGPIKHRPITNDPDLKTAIMMIPFGEPDSGMTFKVSFTIPETGQSDTLEFTMIAGNYEELYTQALKAGTIINQGKNGEFFTVKVAAPAVMIISYLNTNNPERVVRASYSQPESFDLFRGSFLVRP